MIILKKTAFCRYLGFHAGVGRVGRSGKPEETSGCAPQLGPLRLPQSGLRSGNPCRVYHRPYHALPARERKAVMTLMGMKADEYLTWSLKEDEELVMQTLHLVISYEDGNRCRLYMPDCIRRELVRAQKAEFMQLLNRMVELK